MFHKSLEDIKKELSQKQGKRFKELMKNFEGCDKLDIIYKLAKRRVILVKKL